MTEETPVEREGWLFGRRAIIEALAAGRPVERIYLAQETSGAILAELRHAAAAICEVDLVPRAAIDRYARGVHHQGVAARVAMVSALKLADWLESTKSETNVQAILCDGIVDPGNLGAIIRSATVFGASAVLLGNKHAPLSATVAKTSAGCIFHMPIVICDNLGSALKDLKDAGYWVYATAEQAEESIIDVEIPARLIWAIGSEELGVSRVVTSLADKTVSIPTAGKTKSLNASVAAGVVLFTTLSARLIP